MLTLQAELPRQKANGSRTSYRSLLDTAETIIDMEIRMDQVESKLSTVGQHCSSRGLERISSNASKMDSHIRSHGQSIHCTEQRAEG